jgi:hypothetical protein
MGVGHAAVSSWRRDIIIAAPVGQSKMKGVGRPVVRQLMHYRGSSEGWGDRRFVGAKLTATIVIDRHDGLYVGLFGPFILAHVQDAAAVVDMFTPS